VTDTFLQGGPSIIDIIEHPNTEKYPDQQLYILNYKEYIYVVPVEIHHDSIELKTIFRSRKFDKIYNVKRKEIYET